MVIIAVCIFSDKRHRINEQAINYILSTKPHLNIFGILQSFIIYWKATPPFSYEKHAKEGEVLNISETQLNT